MNASPLPVTSTTIMEKKLQIAISYDCARLTKYPDAEGRRGQPERGSSPWASTTN